MNPINLETGNLVNTCKKKSIENGDNIFWPGPKKKKREKKVVGGAGEVIEQVES